MGSVISGVKSLVSKSKPPKILVLGFDCSGKTTILYKLFPGKIENIIPMIGTWIEVVKHSLVEIQSWDTWRGNPHMYQVEENYFFNDVVGVVFVVDSWDHDLVKGEAASEIKRLDGSKKLSGVPLLVFANKIDLENALSVDETSKQLNLGALSRQWHIQGSNATKGEGLKEGMQWLFDKTGIDLKLG